MSRVKSTLRVRPSGTGPAEPTSAAATGQAFGRSVFAVRTVEQAVSVETMLLHANGQLQRMPAIFPTRAYAMQQIDLLARVVQQQFDDLQPPQSDPAQSVQPETPAA